MSLKRTIAGLALSISVMVGGTSALANQDLFLELEEETTRVRQLDLLEPLDVTVKSRDELKQEALEDMEADFPVQETSDWNQVLVFLGYIEEGDDISEIYTDLMGDQILGYYDPSTRQMVVVSTSSDDWGPTDRSTFVHETVHALQDQHFDLRAIQTGDGRNTDDLYFARTSLIEGDATLAETIYLMDNDLLDAIIEEQSGMDVSGVDNAPLFLRESLYFPYISGAEFVAELWVDGGWDRVNEAWENPPTTSEQIIHPEKYVEGEEAIPVAINDPLETLGDDWRLLEYNENGELGTYIFLLNGGASEREATRASEGWGGDSTFIVTNDDETAMVWTSAWDTEDDAVEYFDQLIATEVERLGATQEEIDENTVAISADGWYGYVARDGDVVTHYLAQSDTTLELLQDSQVDATVPETIPGATPQGTPEASPVAQTDVSFWVREA